MRDGKSTQSRYLRFPPGTWSLLRCPTSRSASELAPKSHIAEEAVRRTSEALKPTRPSKAPERLKPGEMLIEHEGKPVKESLLSPKWARRLAEGLSVTAVRRHLTSNPCLAEVFEDATIENLWRWLTRRSLPDPGA